MRLIPNLQIFAWHFQVMSTLLVCQLNGKWKRRISKWNWPRRSQFTSFLGEQNKVSQKDPRNVFSLTRLELLHSCLSAAFAIRNRKCQPLTFCASSSYMLPCDVSAGWFFQEAVPLCSLAACKASQNYSHQEPVQHNSSLVLLHNSLSLWLSLHSEAKAKQLARLHRALENMLSAPPGRGCSSPCYSVPDQTYDTQTMSATEKVRKCYPSERFGSFKT